MSDNKEKDIVPPSPLNNPEEYTLSPKEKHFAKLNEAKIILESILFNSTIGLVQPWNTPFPL